MIKIRILKKKKDVIYFLLEGITPAFANALRRIMISEIPVLAIEWVDTHDNTSALFDEILAHRLAMIPLEFNPDKFNMPDNCKCSGKGCPLCQAVFVIEKKGPCIVYSKDMKSYNKDVKPTSPSFPITELLENHSIKLDAVSILGTGRNHAKFQAANASYQYYPEEILIEDSGKESLSKIPKTLYTLSGKKINLKDPTKIDFFKGLKGIKVREDENKFLFRVESISGLKPEYIVSKAAEILIDKAEEFKKEISKI